MSRGLEGRISRLEAEVVPPTCEVCERGGAQIFVMEGSPLPLCPACREIDGRSVVMGAAAPLIRLDDQAPTRGTKVSS